MQSLPEARKKVIIDTDIGDDIDDAFALYLALRTPELEIAGITTVFKNTRKRAQIVAHMLRLDGRGDIPVVPGSSKPIVNRTVHGRPIQLEEAPYQFLPEMEGEAVSQSQTAADFIIQTVMESEEPVTIITLGAMTNVAIALLAKPELAERLDSIIMMGGAYQLHLNEYNISCDPEAARIVLQSNIKIIAVGLDVTFKCLLPEASLERIYTEGGPLGELLGKMKAYWAHTVYLHDPLAVALAFQPQFVTLQRQKIDIEIKEGYTRGMVINLSDMNWQQPAADSNIWVSTAVDAEGFIAFYTERVLNN